MHGTKDCYIFHSWIYIYIHVMSDKMWQSYVSGVKTSGDVTLGESE